MRVCPVGLETKGLAVVPPSLGAFVRLLSLPTVEDGLSYMLDSPKKKNAPFYFTLIMMRLIQNTCMGPE